MREKVKHYQGLDITSEVIKKMNLIELLRQKEGLTTFTIENIDNIEELCNYHDTKPEQENIIIGEDWYIIYTIYDNELEFQEWISINNVKDKLMQTMEMFKCIKNILIENKDKIIYSTLRRSTSYKFYKKFLEEKYLKELNKSTDIDEFIPNDLLMLIRNKDKDSSLEQYLDFELEENLEDLPDFIYHNIEFTVSDKFIKKYSKR